MASIVTRPLREEHEQMRPRLEVLRRAADAVGRVPVAQLAEFLDPAIAFLEADLLPHAAAESRVLYPVVSRLMRSPLAARAMGDDQREIARLAGELGMLRGCLWLEHPGDLDDLRGILCTLHTLALLHCSKEEDVLVPLLEQALKEEDARELFAAMEAAVDEARFSAVVSRARA